MEGVKGLIVYKKAFNLSMDIFHIAKKYPSEEKYSLISQIRRSARSVCSNLAEGYRKRIYTAHFIAKVSDADMENSETQTWLDFSLACEYISIEEFSQSNEVGRLLNHMLHNPEKYVPVSQKTILTDQ